jgi:chromosome segregation ATPase
VKRNGGEITLSLSDIRKKVSSLRRAIQERERLISSLERSDDPESIVKIVSLRNEVSILQAEREKLEVEYEKRKAQVEQQYPKLLEEYEEKVEVQKRILGEVIEAAKTLKEKIEKLRRNIDEVEKSFHPYRNLAFELEMPTKHMHLAWGDVFIRLSRELGNFLSWYQKTRGG